MFAFWKFFITHSRFSFLMMVALALFGLYAAFAIQKESSPEVQIPVGIVTTVLPGASAFDVEELVTDKIEQQLSGSLTGLRSLTSTSRENVSTIVAEFDATVEVEDAIQELKDLVDTARPDLPADATDPIVSEINFVDQPILSIAISGNRTDEEFAILAKSLEAEIESIPGVSRAEPSGVREREVSVIVDPASLARYSLTLQGISSALRAANSSFPAGSITTDGVRYAIAFDGTIQDPANIGAVPVGTFGGQSVYLRDVAIVDDSLSPIVTISRLSVDGAPSESSINFDVYKRTGSDITTIASAVNARLAELQEPGELLADLSVVVPLDSGALIAKDLIQLSGSGIQTVLLVMVALFLTLGWREALIAGSAVPLSFLIAFIALMVTDNTINFISLFALILGVGILVDSAIVMVEGINRRMKENPQIGKVTAALDTVKAFHMPIAAGTLTTVAMFSGLFLVGGISGDFISGIPYTINFLLLASLLVALGFIPLIASMFLRRRNLSKLEERQIAYARRIEGWYRNVLSGLVGNRRRERIFLASIFGGFVIAILLPIIGVVQVIFFDQEDIDWLYAQVTLPVGESRESTDLIARAVEEILYKEPMIESFTTTVGAGSPFAGGGMGVSSSRDEHLASFFINLRTDRDDSSTEVVARLAERVEEALPTVNVEVGQPNNGPPTGTPIVIQFLGDDLAELSDFANRGAEILKSIPGTTNVRSSANDTSTEYALVFDPIAAAAYGLNPESVSAVLRGAVYGIEATDIRADGDDMRIMVRLALNPEAEIADDAARATIDDVLSLAIPIGGGDTVLLGSLVEVVLRESSTAIAHEDRKRVMTVSADTAPGGNVFAINTEFEQRANAELGLGNGVTMSLGGENEESTEAFRDMFIALIVGALGMLVFILLEFNSFRHTAYVLCILPFSLIGIMFGLAITGKALSFPSLMGFIALSGIVVNNSILLIDVINSRRAEKPDAPVRDAVIEGAASRLRPILLTSTTTIIGMIPLLFVSDLWSPLAYAIMFGLAFSVIITLVLVPVIYNRWPGTVRQTHKINQNE